MTGLVDWATDRARMIILLVVLTLVAGWTAYTGLPKEGEPDIDVPVLVVTAPLPGVSAEDSETLLVRPLETHMRDLDGLKEMSATAAEGVAILVLEFEFGWDRAATLADTRDKLDKAKAEFPEAAQEPTISEINFSEFPILVVSLSGNVPERTLFRIARDLQTEVESLGEVLEAGLAGYREEMLEVLIDPLRLEAYNVTPQELLSVVVNNNQLVAAGEVRQGSGAYSVKIPSSFDDPQDVYNLPVKVNGDRVITLGDLADIRLTFEDPQSTARYNGEPTVALQVVKRKGVNLIDTVALVREVVNAQVAAWPTELQAAVTVNFSMDESTNVADMVSQLEASVLTAIALVMIVVLAALGTRSALLVGFAIPTSFLLAFALFGVLDFAVSNIVMFGLILAVGMLVDGAIVVVEYADKKIEEGVGPMNAYGQAAKRMFWPIVSSTATTLCAFLPMLLWPGIPGEFMGMLPVTLIFVLSCSLLVALIYLPVVGGVAGRFTRFLEQRSTSLRHSAPFVVRLLGVVAAALGLLGAFYILSHSDGTASLLAVALLVLMMVLLSVVAGSVRREKIARVEAASYKRTPFGRVIALIVGNPVMPVVVFASVVAASVYVIAFAFPANNNGVEFFVETEPERAVAYVRARGNLSLDEKDRLVREVEEAIEGIDGIESVFAFAGNGGLNQNGGGAAVPKDTVGQIQIELDDWRVRRDGNEILADIDAAAARVPGVIVEITEQAQGPANGKPVHLRIKGSNMAELRATTAMIRAQFMETEGLTAVDDTLPLPGIDWQIDVDVETAGRYGADVATVGGMVQLVTRGILLDTMRTETSDEEIEIRVRFPEEYRVLSTLDTLKVRTPQSLVPLSNFITRTPVPKLAEINRIDTQRYFDVLADVEPGINANEKIDELSAWLETAELPAGIKTEWTGDREEQEESGAFLAVAMLAALGLMFVILLAQFNSFYNSVVVLLAVVLSTVGVLIGMMAWDLSFSIIMTGTGILALAGIVVNNNIVLIDTYQEFSRYMPKLEAIIRTAEARIRPVLLTTITTIAGLLPMAFALSVDFINGGYSLNAPTAMWWIQLASAVVWGLGIATILTLMLTPALLALRIWLGYLIFGGATYRKDATREGRAQDRAMRKQALRTSGQQEFVWDDLTLAPTLDLKPAPMDTPKLSAAE